MSVTKIASCILTRTGHKLLCLLYKDMRAVVADEVTAALAKASIDDKTYHDVETNEEKIEQKASAHTVTKE